MASMTWLVTGCSAGFGEAFVTAIVNRGDRVIATARNISDIKRIQGDNVAILQLDLTESETSIQIKIQEAIRLFGSIDVLVNNAGYVQGGPFELVSTKQLDDQFRTNYFGTLNITRAILPYFRARRMGHLVWVSSRAGWKGEPCSSAYCGSKFALEGTAECIRLETAEFGIKTYIFEPGQFRTRVFDASKGVIFSDSTIEDYDPLYHALKKQIASTHNAQSGDPHKFVEVVIDIVRDEGVAQGKPKPIRLPVGSDALDVVRKKALETLRICEEWESVITNVEIVDPPL